MTFRLGMFFIGVVMVVVLVGRCVILVVVMVMFAIGFQPSLGLKDRALGRSGKDNEFKRAR